MFSLFLKKFLQSYAQRSLFCTIQMAPAVKCILYLSNIQITECKQSKTRSIVCDFWLLWWNKQKHGSKKRQTVTSFGNKSDSWSGKTKKAGWMPEGKLKSTWIYFACTNLRKMTDEVQLWVSNFLVYPSNYWWRSDKRDNWIENSGCCKC